MGEGFLAERATPARHADSLPYGAGSFLAERGEKELTALGERGGLGRVGSGAGHLGA
jgi:hypothetical protein